MFDNTDTIRWFGCQGGASCTRVGGATQPVPPHQQGARATGKQENRKLDTPPVGAPIALPRCSKGTTGLRSTEELFPPERYVVTPSFTVFGDQFTMYQHVSVSADRFGHVT